MSKRFGKGIRYAYRDVKDEKTKKIVRKLVRISKPRPGIHHTVLPDSMDPVQHPSNGEIVDSRKRYNQILKEHGHEVVDQSFFESNINDAVQVGCTDDDYHDAAARAYYEVNNGMAPIREEEREMLRRIDERNRNR